MISPTLEFFDKLVEHGATLPIAGGLSQDQIDAAFIEASKLT